MPISFHRGLVSLNARHCFSPIINTRHAAAIAMALIKKLIHERGNTLPSKCHADARNITTNRRHNENTPLALLGISFANGFIACRTKEMPASIMPSSSIQWPQAEISGHYYFDFARHCYFGDMPMLFMLICGASRRRFNHAAVVSKCSPPRVNAEKRSHHRDDINRKYHLGRRASAALAALTQALCGVCIESLLV